MHFLCVKVDEEFWELTKNWERRKNSEHFGPLWEGSYMGRPSPRILVQAGLIGVFFAARILRGEIPRYRLPLPEFAANFYTRSCLLRGALHDVFAARIYVVTMTSFSSPRRKWRHRYYTILAAKTPHVARLGRSYFLRCIPRSANVKRDNIIIFMCN